MKTATFLLTLLVCAFSVHAAGRPNIVFIMADDRGCTDTATYGSKYYEMPKAPIRSRCRVGPSRFDFRCK